MNYEKIARENINLVVQELCDWIKINSVYDESTINEKMPFGQGVYYALEYIAELAEQYGFNVDRCDGYCTEISYGQGEDIVMIMGHADVVPTGANWQYDPFLGEVVDGYVYGRGSEDDKGPTMASFYALKILKDKNLLVDSEGAQVVEVAKEDDNHPIPPTIVIKSNGSEGYATTDIATIIQRQKDFAPDKIWYVVDFRQNLHFTQVFRTAQKAELIPSTTELTHLCFGTVNGKDGKPFKTRDGGVMQLSDLLDTVVECAYEKLRRSDNVEESVKKETAEKIGIAAIKFGDLINHYSKDCIFDLDKFMASEGKTGVYLLYVVARINSIMRKNQDNCNIKLNGVYSEGERDLLLKLALSGNAFLGAYNEKSPNILCENAYQIAVAFSKFYHDNHIISETDDDKKSSWLSLCTIVKAMLIKHLDTLGIETVEVM